MLRSQSLVRIENLRNALSVEGRVLTVGEVDGLKMRPGDTLRLCAKGTDAGGSVAALASDLSEERMPGFTVHRTGSYKRHVGRATADYYGEPRYLGQEELLAFEPLYEEFLRDRRRQGR